MFRYTVLALLLAAAPARAEFRSVTVDLPADDAALPGGKGVEAVRNTCLVCHSAGMILAQPGLPAAVWQAEVQKMRGVYKASIADSDINDIVTYLTSLQAPQ